jgi:hypothetical protein
VLSDADRRAEYDARMDVMARVAEGVPEAPSESEPVTTARKVLDLSRECVFCKKPHTYGNVIEIDTGCQACGSPLYPAERRRMESAGQRAVERIDKRKKITYYTHWPQPGGFVAHIEDISLNGLRLVTKQDLVEGQCIKIVSDVVEAIAHVTHCLYERRGWTKRCVAGVSFVTLRFGKSVGGFVSDRV